MTYEKFSDMSDKIKNDLDLNEETFISPTELVGYFNEAVAMIEYQIHTLCEDYFLTMLPIPVTAGDTAISLPSNMYANKIRKVIWNLSQAEKYEITPIFDLMETQFIDTNAPYRYLLLNDAVSGTTTPSPNLRMYPALRSTSSTALLMFYIRGANKYVDEDSVCDIPEWANVINQYVRYKCLLKEKLPEAAEAKVDLDLMIVGMQQALSSRKMDENTKLAMDPRVLSEYSDFTINDWYSNYW